MTRNRRFSRRTFLRSAAAATAALAAPYVVPTTSFGANGRITAGIIGLGGPAGGARGAQIEFIGTEGRVMVDRGTLATDPPHILKKPIGPDEVRLYTVTGGHKGNWAECIRTRARPICDVEIGCRSVTVCHIGNIAYWLKRPLTWDPVTEDFIGDPEASRWLSRPMRPPWRLG